VSDEEFPPCPCGHPSTPWVHIPYDGPTRCDGTKKENIKNVVPIGKDCKRCNSDCCSICGFDGGLMMGMGSGGGRAFICVGCMDTVIAYRGLNRRRR
jgi:hypothetical protein